MNEGICQVALCGISEEKHGYCSGHQYRHPEAVSALRNAFYDGEKHPVPAGARKFDTGKLRWDLLPFRAVKLVVQVMTFGAAKYEPNNWQGIEVERYEAAMFRHYEAWRSGEVNDTESGLPHLAHMACCSLFILAIKHGIDPVRP